MVFHWETTQLEFQNRTKSVWHIKLYFYFDIKYKLWHHLPQFSKHWGITVGTNTSSIHPMAWNVIQGGLLTKLLNQKWTWMIFSWNSGSCSSCAKTCDATNDHLVLVLMTKQSCRHVDQDIFATVQLLLSFFC